MSDGIQESIDGLSTALDALLAKNRLLLTASEKARIELAQLVPNPANVTVEDWPVESAADAECLQKAWVFLTDAMLAAEQDGE